MQIASLEASMLDDNARLLARAFEIDPAYRYLMPDSAKREAGLAEFFARNQRVHLPYRCTYVARDERGALAATVTLRPPEGIAIGALTMLRHGLLPFALRHGRHAVKRLLWLKHTYDALELAAARGAPHFYVHMMAVRPDLQGCEPSPRLLAAVLERGVSQQAAETVLTTHLPENLLFYRRAGFTVIDERRLEPPQGAAYTVWSMLRAV